MPFTPLAELLGNRLFISGGLIEYVSASQITVGLVNDRTVLRDEANEYTMRFTGKLTLDLTVSGVGGIDVGSEAASTWYSVWIIADSTATDRGLAKAILSTSPTFPTLPPSPATFDVARRIGWIRNDGSSDIIKFFMFGCERSRVWFYDAEQSAVQVLVGGNATSFTNIDLSAFVPPTSTLARMHTEFNPGAQNRATRIRTNGSTIAVPVMTLPGAGNNPTMAFTLMPTDQMQRIQYEVDNVSDALDVFIGGWEESC